jgi:hypothetical protein
VSFTAYATAVAGSILTAAFWNQQVRDNGTVQKTSIRDDGHLYDSVIVTKTANYTAAITDDLIICTTNAFDVTLPTAVGNGGKQIKVKNKQTVNAITMKTTSAQTIDGGASGSLLINPGSDGGYFTYTFESDGSNWLLV